MLNGRTLEFTVQPMENGGMVALVEDITERKIAEAKINHLARFDPLTGLPNRNILRDHMERALGAWRPDNMCAVHFVDLDQFKQVNDTLGHTRGDMLLEAVAERLQTSIRDADVISRFGGDEFVIFQAPIKSLDQAEALATRALNAVAGTYDLDGHKVVVTASIGIAVAKNRIDPDQFLRNADMALYQAKSDGRGTWRWFEAKMEANAQARRNLELDLRNAMENEAFELHYQPLFNLKTRRIEACEALLRWPHQERGMVSPAEFIPVAEEMGLIVEIGNQVLYKACLECRRWPGDTAVAVNLSSIQFDRSNVPALVRETLAATNLAPQRLEIEITESTLLQDTKRTRADLNQLAELGVKISLDDFGTAYSSLSYLHSFPLHKVKIDQSFLQGLGDDERRVTLLRGITRLSAQLGLKVVVEGVETQEQFDLLAAEDSIDEVQGYLLCRPMPAADLRKLLYASYVAPAQISSWPAKVRNDENLRRRNVGCIKQLPQIGRRHGPAKQVSLHFVDAVFGGEQIQLLLGLDALDNNLQAQLRAQPRHAAQQGHPALVVAKALQERLVDLHLVQRKAVQIAEARIGGAKIVQRDLHAELGQLAQVGAGSLRVLKQS